MVPLRDQFSTRLDAARIRVDIRDKPACRWFLVGTASLANNVFEGPLWISTSWGARRCQATPVTETVHSSPKPGRGIRSYTARLVAWFRWAVTTRSFARVHELR